MARRRIEIEYASPKTRKEFKYLIISDNGKPISDRDFYKRKPTLLKMLAKYFPGYQVVDKTLKDVK